MSSLNTKKKIYTHEGAVAKQINPDLQLRRSVMACMLWESNFYESGITISQRISDLVKQVRPEKVAAIAIEAREKMKLRHVPLLLVREMARHDTHKGLVADTLGQVIQRADELMEFLSIYWKDGKQPLSAQVKKGLAKAFVKFDAYQLAKYNRDKAVKLRDVLFLSHAKPVDKQQEETWKKLINGDLAPPDTWEVALSSGGDKTKHWKRLLKESTLGAMALLRNIRNLQNAGVDRDLLKNALKSANYKRVLPFRFIAAARYAPSLEDELQELMLKCLDSHDKMDGRTVLLVDVSGSMEQVLSRRSEMTYLDAACGLAIILREICEDIYIFTFSNHLVEIPSRHGFALRDAIIDSQPHQATYLGRTIKRIYENRDNEGPGINMDRLIVITDEQSHDCVPDPKRGKGYMINIGSMKNGVGYGAWMHVDGWSESVVDYILEKEKTELS